MRDRRGRGHGRRHRPRLIGDRPRARRERKSGGYRVTRAAASSRPGQEAELGFLVTRGRKPVHVEPYLGADGHLVALREGDLAYLHVHPTEGDEGGIRFATEFPTDGAYRLFLQFKHDGQVRTAAFTQQVAR